MLSTDTREGVADALLAVGGGEDVVDAGLDLLDRVQVAAVLHCLWGIIRVMNGKLLLLHWDLSANTKIKKQPRQEDGQTNDMQYIENGPKTLKMRTPKVELTVDLILAVQQLSDAAAGPLNLG